MELSHVRDDTMELSHVRDDTMELSHVRDDTMELSHVRDDREVGQPFRRECLTAAVMPAAAPRVTRAKAVLAS